jgi:pimeloyl-ACP methyl ester carboxylesterase
MSSAALSESVEPVAIPVTDGLVLRGDARGDPDGRIVVLLHGGGQTRHAWTETAEALAARGFRALALDLRGHGDSDWDAEGRYDFPNYGADTEELLRQLPRPSVLVGASLGGISSLMAAGLGPQERCAGLVLVDVAPHIEPQGAERVLRFMGASPDGFGSLEEVAAAVAAYNPHRTRPPDLRNLEKNLRRRPEGRWVWHWDPKFLTVDRSSDRGRSALLERAARALRAPTLLVRGRQSDILSEEGVRRFRALVPHAHFSDVSGAGHMVAGDRNDAFTQAVLEFLAAIG